MQDVLKNNQDYAFKFVVHNAANVLFVSEEFHEVQTWVNLHQPRSEEELQIFLVPNDFGSLRLRMLKIKSLSSGE